MAFSIGKPFRKPMDSNPLFMANVVIMGVYVLFVILTPDSRDQSVHGVSNVA